MPINQAIFGAFRTFCQVVIRSSNLSFWMRLNPSRFFHLASCFLELVDYLVQLACISIQYVHTCCSNWCHQSLMSFYGSFEFQVCIADVFYMPPRFSVCPWPYLPYIQYLLLFHRAFCCLVGTVYYTQISFFILCGTMRLMPCTSVVHAYSHNFEMNKHSKLKTLWIQLIVQELVIVLHLHIHVVVLIIRSF